VITTGGRFIPGRGVCEHSDEELAQTGWNDEEKAVFCRRQFNAQSAHYRANYPDASFQLIERDSEAIGRLYVARWERNPDHRHHVATRISRHGNWHKTLRDLQDEARTAGKSLTIHVERFNRALQLYERLGFRQVEDKGVYLLLEWSSR